jgi:type IV fimbrial biogenesis protein FimT
MLDRISRTCGVTLIELLVVLGVVAIIAGFAAPLFNGLLLDSRRTAAIATAMHGVNLARQLAAIRGEAIRLCGSRDAQQCSGTADWSSGLLVADARDSLRRSLPLPGGAGASAIRANRQDVTFEGGTGFATPATLTICDRRGGSSARAIIISRSGRPRVSARDAGDGPIAC